MFKKTLLVTTFILTAILVSGCQSPNDTATNNTNYTIATVTPENVPEGIKDETEGFKKINKNFDSNNILQKQEY